MTPERWQQLKPLFFEAVDQPPSERAAFLDRACGTDAALRAELDGLLAAEEDAPPILGASPEQLVRLVETEVAGLPPTLVGQTVGPYRIVREIGHGGMGTVYLAERADVDKRVALKLLRRFLTTPETTRRFLAERRILARLEHPNVARLLDAGMTGDGAPFFAMEYVEGRPLTDYCDARRLTVTERLALFAEACEAVRYAHQNLVIHRDLKPSNILVTEDAEGHRHVKLLDFGIAKLIEEDADEPGLTRSGLRAMTPAYAAPEQVRGEPVTTATDVYALGVILYELLVGRRPFPLAGTSRAELERRICDQPPKPPSAGAIPAGDRERDARRLRKHLRGDLDTIVLKALRKEPERRYRSVEHLADDIALYLDGRPVTARPDTWTYRAGKFARRHALALALAAGALVLATTLTLLYTVRLAQARAAAEAEAAKARRVATFLGSVLQAADPAFAEGGTVLARDLLDRGAARIDEELADQPDIRAIVLVQLGDAYEKLGLHDQARGMLEDALAIRRERFGDRDPRVAEVEIRLASLLLDSNDYRQARELYRHALDTLREHLGPQAAELVPAFEGLAHLARVSRQPRRALELQRQALAINERHFGPQAVPVATSLIRLADVLRSQEAHDQAIPLYRRAVAIWRRQEPPNRLKIADARCRLASSLQHEDAAAAAALCDQALGALEQALGAQHSDLGGALRNCGYVFLRHGDGERALASVRRAHAISAATYGAHSSITLTLLGDVVQVLYVTGRPHEALPHLEEMLEVLENLLGTESTHLIATLTELASMAMAAGEHERAVGYYRRALAIQRTNPTSDRSVLDGLAEVARSLGAREDAAGLRAQALSLPGRD